MTRKPKLLLILLLLPLLLGVWLGYSHFAREATRRLQERPTAGCDAILADDFHRDTVLRDAVERSGNADTRPTIEPGLSPRENTVADPDRMDNPVKDKLEAEASEENSPVTGGDVEFPVVSGRVLDHRGFPVPGAAVSFRFEFNPGKGYTFPRRPPKNTYERGTTADANGQYIVELRDWVSDDLVVRVTTPFNEDVFDLTGIKVNGKYSGVDLVLTPRGAVKGRVVTLEGEPVAGVKVRSAHGRSEIHDGLRRLSDKDEEPPPPGGYHLANRGFNNSFHEDDGKTDAKGEYRLTGLAPGEHELEVDGQGKFLATGKTIVVIQAGAEAVAPDVRVSKSAVLRLRPVLDGKTFSYGTAKVTFLGVNGRKISDADAKVNFNGMVEIDAVPPDAAAMWLVVSTFHGQGGHHSSPSAVPLQAGASGILDLGDITVEKTPAPVKLKLRVMLDGKPVADERVKVVYSAVGNWFLGESPYGSKTNAEGWVEIGDVPARVSTIEVSYWRRGVTFKADGPIFVNPAPGKTIEVGEVHLR